MAESVVQGKYVDEIPRFQLPPELTNPDPAAPPPEAKPEGAKAAPPETPPEQKKPEELEETARKDEEKRSQRSIERRIDRLRKQAAEAQARAELTERQLQEERQKNQPKPPEGRPKLEEFSDVAEFDKALEAYHRENAKKDAEKQHQERAIQEGLKRLTDKWEAQVDRAALKYDDFYQVVGDLEPKSPWVVAIMEADNGDEIAYYLGKNPKEAERIISLSPVSQIREIGKLELKLSQKAEEPKRPSKAPEPITPVSGRSESPSDEIRENMSPEEYFKIGNKMFRGRR